MKLLRLALLGALYGGVCVAIFLLEWAKERLGAAIKDEPKPTPEEPEA